MKHRFRDGTLVEVDNGQDKFLKKLYGNAFGRFCLKPLTARWVSRLGGWYMSRIFSRGMIKSFIKKNNIDMSQFQEANYRCYNDFFTRKIRPEARPVDMDASHLISPCDCKLTVLPITRDCRLMLKNTEYTVESLLRDPELAAAYEGGTAMIFRLCVDDYHRYGFPADGIPGEPVTIPGVLHTVQPIAGDYVPVYKENAREYTLLRTPTFGDVIQMEEGALMVGDTAYDVIGAAQHGIPCAGVSWGYGLVEDMEKANAAVIVKDTAELLTFITEERV
jgi:phosphatidylserine decarboxylase